MGSERASELPDHRRPRLEFIPDTAAGVVRGRPRLEAPIPRSHRRPDS